MNPNTYQKFVLSLLSPETLKDQMVNAALGLTGEAGEYADMVKKHKHHNHEFDRKKALLELGDILFYLASAADEQGSTLEEVMMLNVDKLSKRYPNGAFSVQDSKDKKDQMEYKVLATGEYHFDGVDIGNTVITLPDGVKYEELGTTGTTGNGGCLPTGDQYAHHKGL